MNSELIKALRDKLVLLEKMRHNLEYSFNKITPWWSVSTCFDDWSDDQLESLAAFKGRFAELQDHLASAMSMIASIENQDTRVFTYVLNYMMQLHLLESMERWMDIRELRNASTHDYSQSEETKAFHFASLLRNTHYLFETLDSLLQFSAVAYPKK